MYKFDEILIALDLSKADENLIRYGFGVGNIVEAKEIILAHVSKEKLSAEVSLEDGSTMTMQEQIEKRIATIAQPIADKYPQIKLLIRVLEGDPLSIMLKASKEKKVDLIIVGRKSVGQGSGKVARELARRALCSVFSVPFNAKLNFNRILLPIDYSEYSEMALKKALSLAKNHAEMELLTLSIYTLPQGYLQSGKTEAEFAAIMQKNTEKRYKHFMKKFDTSGVSITPKYQLDTKDFFAKIIFNVALVEDADLIIIGSKGRTTFATFLGSTTEKLLKQNMSIPTLVLKKREGNLGFFEALLNI